MKARKITKEESLIYASGEYLCENIPTDFFDWEEDKQDKFLEDFNNVLDTQERTGYGEFIEHDVIQDEDLLDKA